MHAPRPTVIILDFDGTMIGDIEWLAQEYTLFQQLNQHAVKTEHRLRYSPVPLLQDLDQGMIRAHLGIFLRYMKAHYPTFEFFIYTASEAEWAEFILPRVESRLGGFKFHRPFFTRQHCVYRQGKYIKTLDKIMPAILRRLHKAYPHVKTAADLQACLLIDNCPFVLTEQTHHLLCPTYGFRHPVDLLRQVPPAAVDRALPYAAAMLGIKAEGVPAPVLKALYYKKLSRLFMDAYQINRHQTKDVFWKRILRAFSAVNLTMKTTAELRTLLSSAGGCTAAAASGTA